jgi:hypothetical protein
MDKDEALKLALEALETCEVAWPGTRFKSKYFAEDEVKAAITAIKQALAADVREPVACVQDLDEVKRKHLVYEKGMDWKDPLYTTPPAQRQWVGLTDDEMRELEKQFEAERVRTSDEKYLVIYPAAYWQWQRAIEAKLKEKNT